MIRLVYLKADIFELRLDFFHQTHVPAVDKVLPTPLLEQKNVLNLNGSSTTSTARVISVPIRPPYFVTADFLKSPVNVEQGHVVSFTGAELLARGEHLFPPGRRVVKHGVH